MQQQQQLNQQSNQLTNMLRLGYCICAGPSSNCCIVSSSTEEPGRISQPLAMFAPAKRWTRRREHTGRGFVGRNTDGAASSSTDGLSTAARKADPPWAPMKMSARCAATMPVNRSVSSTCRHRAAEATRTCLKGVCYAANTTLLPPTPNTAATHTKCVHVPTSAGPHCVPTPLCPRLAGPTHLAAPRTHCHAGGCGVAPGIAALQQLRRIQQQAVGATSVEQDVEHRWLCFAAASIAAVWVVAGRCIVELPAGSSMVASSAPHAAPAATAAVCCSL